ncbi:MAG: hypothetical protein MJ089_06720, partial [Ruminococcus sp.]|nr:hypothetical protein [Ruminococcus sp.]
ITKTFLEVFENHLKERYNPPTILPIPDGAPTDVPLVVMQSISNHTQLILTKSSISIGTGYDEKFNTSWDKCEKHLFKKLQDVFFIIKAIKEVKINYIGLVAQIIKDEDEYNDASKYIFENLLNFKSNKNIYDVDCRLTYVLEDKYYINLEIQNARLFDGKPIIRGNDYTAFDAEAKTQNKLAITIDINNRYHFNVSNINEKFNEDENNVNEIVSYARQIIENVDSIVQGDVHIET